MILEHFFPKRLTPGPDDDYWYQSVGSRTASGVEVDESTALQYSAVFRAVRLLAGCVATLPLHLYLRIDEKNRERVRDHPLVPLLNQRPNPETTARCLRETLTAHVLLWGNGYARIDRVGERPIALWIMAPDRVEVRREEGQIIYLFRDGSEARPRRYLADQVLHLRGLGGDGLVGWSVIRAARESLGNALAAERQAGAFFGNGARPGGVLKHPLRLSDVAAKKLRASWQETHGGAGNAHKVAILEEGMTWEATGIPPEDAQLLDTRKFSVTEIARWFGIPPHLLYDLERATFTNIEAQGLEFLRFSLRYWLDVWSEAVSLSLLTEDEQQDHYCEHLTDALVSADIQARNAAYRQGREGGWLSVNDIRAKENMNPIGPAGDIYLVPANMQPADQLLDPPDAEENDEPENEKPPDPQPEAQSVRDHWTAEVLARFDRRAAAAVRRAVRAENFLVAVEGFYQDQRPVLQQMLAGPCGIAAADRAGQHCQEAFAEWQELAGRVTPPQLAEAVERHLQQRGISDD